MNEQSWSGIFFKWDSTVRLLLFVIALAAILAGGLVGGIWYFQPNEIEFNERGALTIRMAGRDTRYIVLLPASQCWLDTGIDVKPSERAHIVSTGRVHLALGALVLGINGRELDPRRRWIGPNGDADRQDMSELETMRKRLRVMPAAPIGAVLGLAYTGANGARPNCENNPRPKGTTALAAEGIIPGPGRLWLTVNDWVVDTSTESEKAYAGTARLLQQDKLYGPDNKRILNPKSLQDHWQTFVNTKRYDAFFDDNIGEFMIQIRIEE